MNSHLQYAGTDVRTQRQALEAIIRDQPVLMTVLEGLRALALPDHLLVAGAIYNSVWNALSGRPPLTSINGIDVFYFDDSDIGWDAEDRVIKALEVGSPPCCCQCRPAIRPGCICGSNKSSAARSHL